MHKTLVTGLLSWALLAGCGSSGTTSSSFQPVQAQPVSPPSTATVATDVELDANLPTGEVLNLHLQVTGEEVYGDASLSDASDIRPYSVTGRRDQAGIYQLDLLPDDVGPSDSLELVGRLTPGSHLALYRPGETRPVEVRVNADVATSKNELPDQEFELGFYGTGPTYYNKGDVDQIHTLRLKTQGKYGKWHYISKVPLGEKKDRFMPHILPGIKLSDKGDEETGTAEGEVIVVLGGGNVLNIDLYGNPVAKVLVNRLANIKVRFTNFRDTQVPLDADSWIEVTHEQPNITEIFNDEPEVIDQVPFKLRAARQSYLKVLNLGPR